MMYDSISSFMVTFGSAREDANEENVSRVIQTHRSQKKYFLLSIIEKR